jgi:hypothetical protein
MISMRTAHESGFLSVTGTAGLLERCKKKEGEGKQAASVLQVMLPKTMVVKERPRETCGSPTLSKGSRR